jgi:hypothetical protein
LFISSLAFNVWCIMAVFGRRKIHIPQWIVGIERLNCLLISDVNHWIIVKDKDLTLVTTGDSNCLSLPFEYCFVQRQNHVEA